MMRCPSYYFPIPIGGTGVTDTANAEHEFTKRSSDSTGTGWGNGRGTYVSRDSSYATRCSVVSAFAARPAGLVNSVHGLLARKKEDRHAASRCVRSHMKSIDVPTARRIAIRAAMLDRS